MPGSAKEYKSLSYHGTGRVRQAIGKLQDAHIRGMAQHWEMKVV